MLHEESEAQLSCLAVY